jgi:nitroimidazol reductase NimA-like FMN-containing flavoprotein (pyridoxamine 5'-phosphate oxidase superfamily)
MAELNVLSPDECWSLLDRQQFARIAWTGPSGPVVLPVNYTRDGEAVWVRTGAHSELAREADESKVAVLVDEIDPVTHSGWTVLLRGTAHAEYHEERVPEAVRGLVTWASGARPIWLRLAPDNVTGRRMGS